VCHKDNDGIIIKNYYSKILRPCNKNTLKVECKQRSDTNNKRGNWNHLKIIQKIPQPHTRKAQNKQLQKTARLDTAHTYFKKYQHKSTNHSTSEVALHVPCIVITE
jgi:hypothetical protein